MPEGDEPNGPQASTMDPRDAIERMAHVTQQTGGLRVRTEGLTLVIWAICMAASYLTIAVPFALGGDRGEFRGPRPDGFNGTFNGTFVPPPHSPTQLFVSSLAPLAWFAVALVVTIAIWRSASLSFQTGVSTPRLVATLIGWLALFTITSAGLSLGVGGPPQSWHLLAWAVVMAIFALLNPLRFTSRARISVAIGAGVALLAAALAYWGHYGPRDTSFLGGLAVGVPGLLLGLWMMLTG